MKHQATPQPGARAPKSARSVNGASGHAVANAQRAVEEGAMLMNVLGEHFAAEHDTRTAEEFFAKAREAREKARTVYVDIRDSDLAGGEVTSASGNRSSQR